MRYHLEPPVRLGTRQIAVISCIHTDHLHFGSTHILQGKKWPAYIIIKDTGGIAAFDASGAGVVWEDIESACPEAAAGVIDVF